MENIKLSIQNITKKYKNAGAEFAALDGLSVDVFSGEFLSV